jgi:hypothetical protein
MQGPFRLTEEAVPKLQFLEQLLTRACFIEPKVRNQRFATEGSHQPGFGTSSENNIEKG